VYLQVVAQAPAQHEGHDERVGLFSGGSGGGEPFLLAHRALFKPILHGELPAEL